ncbi:hypothetical protein GH714_012761 [Hevea brasiliensis]|uniref:Retrotransposon Copia-like N-terminal domain-containing protein n=1 Tax=Hevea brasiliensis TaxID=3981 RepID=A0A6A6KZT9_HEVBR|nr:hypothetical protein GH714_012761 [Hevea brasiliensis]
MPSPDDSSTTGLGPYSYGFGYDSYSEDFKHVLCFDTSSSMTDSQNSSHSSYSVGTVTHAFNPSEDTSSPYYLHHSKNHSLVIVTPELTLANFASWRRSFLLTVSIRNKQGFLDGSIPKPTPEDPLYISWVQCNNLLIVWLLRSVLPPIASTVFYMEDAKQIWEKLN